MFARMRVAGNARGCGTRSGSGGWQRVRSSAFRRKMVMVRVRAGHVMKSTDDRRIYEYNNILPTTQAVDREVRCGEWQ